MLCSDRRVTSTRAGRVESQEDSAGKTFNFGGWHLAGFTGLARLDGRSMEQWVSGALERVPLSQYRKALAEELTKTFRRSKHPTEPHTFLGVGFALHKGRLEPETWIVSNEVSGGGVVGPEFVDSRFRSVTMPLLRGQARLVAAGQDVPQKTLQETVARVQGLLKADPLAVGPVMDALLDLARDVAAHSDGTVGSSVLVTTLPRASIGVTVAQEYIGPPSEKDLRSLSLGFYCPSKFKGKGAAYRYAPAMISPQFHLTSRISRPGLGEFLPGSDHGQQ